MMVVVRVITGGYKSIVAGRTGFGIGNQLRREVSYYFRKIIFNLHDHLRESQNAKRQCSWLSLYPAKSPSFQHS